MVAKSLDDIMEQVRKLLNVEGRTPEEAAAYVEKAHAVLAAHDLSIEDIADLKADSRTAVRKGDSETTVTEGKPEGWKADVLEAVAAAFECRVLFTSAFVESKSGRLRQVRHGSLIGFGHDVEAAGYANSFLVHEITRLAKAYAREMWDSIKDIQYTYDWTHQRAEAYYAETRGTHPLKAELSFLKGAAETVGDTLIRDARERRRAAMADNPNALVVQKAEEVNDEYDRIAWGYTPEAWAARKERMAKQQEEWTANAAPADLSAYVEQLRREQAAEEAKHAAETPAQHEKCIRKQERKRAKDRAEERAFRERQARKEQAERNRQAKAAARLDPHALEAGRRAGREVAIRPGIRKGSDSAKEAIS
jgi:hypothetical protein